MCGTPSRQTVEKLLMPIPAMVAELLHRGEPHRKTRFLPIGRGFVDGARFGGFVERGTDIAQRLCRVILLARADERKVVLLQGMKPRFDAAVLESLARVAAHAAFG